MTTTPLPWWRTDAYMIDEPMPHWFPDSAGPRGVALVRAWPDGRTDQGWGLTGPPGDRDNGFIPRYDRGEFNDRRVLYGYRNGRWNFAFVMRSVAMVCIDIDGKNGGLEHAKRLGMLPATLAETSRSGDGYHLFYAMAESWTPARGFGRLADRIGIEQGVDVRATGCVYHYPQQRWNGRAPVYLPDHLEELLNQHRQKAVAAAERIVKVLHDNDEVEVLMMQHEILAGLARPIPQGKRNNTLFAIGNQMREAQISDWQIKLEERAAQIGLDADEIVKLVANIERYGSAPTP